MCRYIIYIIYKLTWMILLSMSLAWKRMASKSAREGRRLRSSVTWQLVTGQPADTKGS